MKFILDSGKMILSEPRKFWGEGGYLDKIADKLIEKETEFVFKPLWKMIEKGLEQTWDWLIFNLPDIMGYGAIVAGIVIILYAMAGRGGFIKPMAIYAGLLILALLILGGGA